MADRKIGRVFMARSIAAVIAAVLLVAGLNGHPAAGARGHAKPKATAAVQVPATQAAGLETQATHAAGLDEQDYDRLCRFRHAEAGARQARGRIAGQRARLAAARFEDVRAD